MPVNVYTESMTGQLSAALIPVYLEKKCYREIQWDLINYILYYHKGHVNRLYKPFWYIEVNTKEGLADPSCKNKNSNGTIWY